MLWDDLDGRDTGGVGGRLQRVYARLTHTVVQEKPAQHCKTTVPQKACFNTES